MDEVRNQDHRYKEHLVSLETEQFGNGTAVEVRVDGATVLDRYDARALFVTNEDALRHGTQFAHDYIDGRPSAVGQPLHTTDDSATVNSHNPGEHGKGGE